MIEEDKISNNNEKTINHTEASVKWYNPAKGYGFLTLAENVCDIMIHFSTLDKIGCPYIKCGDRVICDIASGKTGPYVARVIEVKFGSSEPRSLANFTDSRFRPKGLGVENLKDIEGVVKWYNSDKGYGFIIQNDGEKEIFLHSSVLHVIGYKELQPGTRVIAKIITSERGAEARTIRILNPEENKKVS